MNLGREKGGDVRAKTTIFTVTYEARWDSPGSDWIQEEVNVLAQNGEAAISKARRSVLSQAFRDEDTKKSHKCIEFKLMSLSVAAQADL